MPVPAAAPVSPISPADPSRRRWLLAAGVLPVLPLLGGCGTPLPLSAPPADDAAAARRLRESAEVHGLAAYRALRDINVAYDGQWRPLIHRVQPEVVDAGFRGPSQERIVPAAGVVAQAYTGPAGRKQVWWQRGSRAGTDGQVEVWNNGRRSSDDAYRSASALVAEAYGLFLLGPLWLADRGLPAVLAGTERVHGRFCDVVQVWLTPGLGLVERDRVALCIDRADGVCRRLRFTLEGFAGTRGAVAEVDTFDHERRFGVLWPMRSYEEVVHPLRLPAHDWFVTGLDVDRGYAVGSLRGPEFAGLAAAPARAI
ncbi:MAG: hypothetical protein KF683_22515 [Rubrivivax sp.]|nr:hypothetical protein [Rubrivivax sp.]